MCFNMLCAKEYYHHYLLQFLLYFGILHNMEKWQDLLEDPELLALRNTALSSISKKKNEEKADDQTPSYNNNFEVGMKLEGRDPNYPLFCVVSVAKVRDNRICLHFDGYADSYDFWTKSDSQDIFPIGWSEKNGQKLQPPKGFTAEEFKWESYLETSKAKAAPEHLFSFKGKQVPENIQNSVRHLTLPSTNGLKPCKNLMSSTDSSSKALAVSIPSDSLGSNLQSSDSVQEEVSEQFWLCEYCDSIAPQEKFCKYGKFCSETCASAFTTKKTIILGNEATKETIKKKNLIPDNRSTYYGKHLDSKKKGAVKSGASFPCVARGGMLRKCEICNFSCSGSYEMAVHKKRANHAHRNSLKPHRSDTPGAIAENVRKAYQPHIRAETRQDQNERSKPVAKPFTKRYYKFSSFDEDDDEDEDEDEGSC